MSKQRTKSSRAWLWPAANMLMFLLCFVLLWLVFSHSTSLQKRSMESGQRLEIALGNGDINGLPLITAVESLPEQLPIPINEGPVIDGGLPGNFSNKDIEENLSSKNV